MTEYNSPEIAIFAGIVAFFWALDFWSIIPSNKLPLSRIDQRGRTLDFYGRVITFLLGLMGWSLIIYSMTGPRVAQSMKPSSRDIRDIYIVVDVSRSMTAEDLKPNRLEVTKDKLREFARLRVEDRVGLIAFSEKAFTLMPLSTDPDLLDKIIADINIGYLGSGTNIGDGLALAVARLAESEIKNKLVILLTDGVANIGNFTPIQAAEEAKKFGIKVYTIGVGTQGEAKMPVGKSIFGTSYQNIPGGSIDYKTLKEMAALTGGKFYPATDESALESMFREISLLEKTEIKIDDQMVYDEKYYWPYFWGFLMLLSSIITKKFWLKDVM